MSEGSRDSCGNHSNIKISDTHTHTTPGGCHGGGGFGGKKSGKCQTAHSSNLF